MYNLVLTFHVIISLALITLILVQRGRSGGLVEALGGVESIFGTKTNSFFVKATVVLAVLFFICAMSLAFLSKRQGKSLMDKYQSQSHNESALPEQTSENLTDTDDTPQESNVPQNNIPEAD
jgi:preprotein translocase subunit SecG